MVNGAAINHFFTVTAGAKSEAEAAKPFHARVILLALLDAISHAAHPSISGNRARFVAFIDEYCQWSLSASYSLRQLALILSEPSAPSSSPGFQGLHGEVASRMQTFPAPGKLVLANQVDPPSHELRSFLTPQLAKYIEPVRYPGLLWSLRNSAVHELREPGAGFDFELKQPSPYYHSLTHDDLVTQTWELFFPTELLSSLLSTGAANLRQRFERDDVDPWAAFPYDPRWYR